MLFTTEYTQVCLPKINSLKQIQSTYILVHKLLLF